MPTFTAAELTDFAAALLRAGKVGPDEASAVAKSLVAANLAGHDSHGVMRVPYYLEAVSLGEIVPGAALTIQSETPVRLTAEGGWGFGQTQAARLAGRLIEKATDSGVAVGTLSRCGHIGRLGEYCEQIAAAGLVSMVMVNTHGNAPRVAPPGGTAPRLGTNPLAFGAPHPDGHLILDFGTSTTAEGKVRVRKIAGQTCPDGWLLDCQGRPTNDPNVLYADPPGTIRPLGGDQAFKGFGLGLMVEIFAGALSAGVCIREVPITPNGNCVFMLVLDPRHLGGTEHFAQEVGQLTDFVRSCPLADGAGPIQLPGDPERRQRAERLSAGIPLDEGNWRKLTELAERLSVPLPGLANATA